MTTVTRPEVLGTGLIALDLVVGPDPGTPVRSWRVERAATYCPSCPSVASTPPTAMAPVLDQHGRTALKFSLSRVVEVGDDRRM